MKQSFSVNKATGSPQESQEYTGAYNVPLNVWVISGAKMSCLPTTYTQTPTDWLCSSKRWELISDSNIHGGEHGIMCTVQPWNSSKRHPAPCSHLCITRILSSALTDRETALLTTDKSSQLERSCPKGRNRGEKKKNWGGWRLIKGKPCFGRLEHKCLKC